MNMIRILDAAGESYPRLDGLNSALFYSGCDKNWQNQAMVSIAANYG